VSKGYSKPHGRDPEALAAQASSLEVDGVTPARQRRAALVICGHAASPDDARRLLDMCGLLDAT